MEIFRRFYFSSALLNGYTFYALKINKTLWVWGDGKNYSPVQIASNIVGLIPITYIGQIYNGITDPTVEYTLSSSGMLSPLNAISNLDDSQYLPNVPISWVSQIYSDYQNYNTFWLDQNNVLWALDCPAGSEPDKIADNVNKIYYSDNDGVVFGESDSSLWGIGNNSQGELGDGTKVPRTEAVKIADDVISAGSYCYLKSNGEFWSWNSDNPTPIKLFDNVAYLDYDNSDGYQGHTGIYLKDGGRMDTWDLSQIEKGFKIPQTVVFN